MPLGTPNPQVGHLALAWGATPPDACLLNENKTTRECGACQVLPQGIEPRQPRQVVYSHPGTPVPHREQDPGSRPIYTATALRSVCHLDRDS